ncbi:MAG: TrkA family potassium uptake protein [Bacteroidetes Order II. Incertae sedis bacterium]|nr:TrkA family potassium uptake protein [Bacteroidetes Order II. bacterium]
MKHAIEALSDHTIICGFGRIGERVAQGLQEAEHPFVVIELSEERAARMQTAGYLYILGNAEEETLDKAGILRAKKLVLALEQDRDNAFLALMARGMNPNLFILARTDYATPHNRSLLTRAGADKVISPYEIGATRMTQLLTRPLVHSFMEELDTFRNLKVEMDEMLVGPDARFNGKSLAMLNIRQAFGAIIIAIHDPIKNETLFNPDAQTIIEAGQTLIVMGVGNQLRDLARACQN